MKTHNCLICKLSFKKPSALESHLKSNSHKDKVYYNIIHKVKIHRNSNKMASFWESAGVKAGAPSQFILEETEEVEEQQPVEPSSTPIW